MRRFPGALPPRGKRLPVWLALLLAVMAAVQLALPVAPVLPVGGAVARLALPATPLPPAPVGVPGVLAARPLFSPSAMGPATATDPLGGALIAGTIQRGPVLYALVQFPGGAIRTLAPGAVIGAWRIAALLPGGARLSDGAGHTMTVAYGAHPAPATPAGNDQ